MASSTNTFKSRQEYKAAKELEEARKAGTAPPAIDSDGKIINPHIPEYIAQAPWYVAQDGPSLKHQRNHNERKRNFDGLGKWLTRGEVAGPASKKFRKGACTNCGALTHDAKACLERPRARGAKVTGTNIRPDEVVDTVNLDFEGKHDRWNGYDVSEFNRVHERYDKLEAARKAVKADQLDSTLRDSGKTGSSGDDGKHLAEGAVVQETGDAGKKAVRNLRIREDTAKYLYNLDLNSAYYDPKSRAMRGDPRPDLNCEDKDFAGDNFVRHTGDVATLAKLELQTMRAGELGKKLPHMQAEPSRAEAVFNELEANKNSAKEKRKAQILEKYGGQAYENAEPLLSDVKQTEAFVEYNSEGKVLNKGGRSVPVSKYAEDVLEKNHIAVWGSYYVDGKWGYACCYQTQRRAMCTGEQGRIAALETKKEMEERLKYAILKRDPKPLTEQWEALQKQKEATRQNEHISIDTARKAHIEQERIVRKQKNESTSRPRNEESIGYTDKYGFKDDATSEAALEEFRLRRHLQDDPMAKYLSKKT